MKPFKVLNTAKQADNYIKYLNKTKGNPEATEEKDGIAFKRDIKTNNILRISWSPGCGCGCGAGAFSNATVIGRYKTTIIRLHKHLIKET